MKLYFDGGCVPNPGKMECAVVSEDGSIEVHNGALGQGTNNQAEWLGFLWAVGLASGHEGPVEILGDSKLVIMQAKGAWKCNVPILQSYLAEFKLMKVGIKNLTLTHVRRERNPAGIFIERLQKG